MASIDINYTVQGLDPLSDAINSLINKLNGLSNNLDNTSKDNSQNNDKSNPVNNTQNSNNNQNNAFTSSIDKSVNAQQALTSKLDNLISALTSMNDTMQKTKGKTSPDELKEQLDIKSKNRIDTLEEELTLRNKKKSEYNKENSFAKLKNALIFGAGVGTIYKAGTIGETSGSEAGVLNQGFGNYSEFQKSQFNRKSGNEQSLVSGGITLGTGVGVGAAVKSGNYGVAGILAGLGIGANYLTSEHYEKNRQINEKVSNADSLAWRLANTGISPTSNSALNSSGGISFDGAKVPFTEYQNKSMSDKYISYDTTLGETSFGARRDVFNKLSTNDKLEYNKQINLFSKLSDNNDIQGISSTASLLSSANNQNPLDAIKTMTNDYVKFGGDTASNTNRMVELMQSAGMGMNQAHDLVNKYQYDSPMLQNKIANATASPFNLFNKALLMSIPGVANSNIGKAQEDARHMKLNPNSIFAQLKMNAYAATGENPFANEIGKIMPNNKKVGNEALTPMMEQTGKAAADFLKDIKITTQNVQAENIYITGKIGPSGYPEITKHSVKGLANTGVSQ